MEKKYSAFNFFFFCIKVHWCRVAITGAEMKMIRVNKFRILFAVALLTSSHGIETQWQSRQCLLELSGCLLHFKGNKLIKVKLKPKKVFPVDRAKTTIIIEKNKIRSLFDSDSDSNRCVMLGWLCLEKIRALMDLDSSQGF